MKHPKPSRFAPPPPPLKEVPPSTPAELRRIALNYSLMLATAKIPESDRSTGLNQAKRLRSLALHLEVDAYVRKAMGLPPAEWNRDD